VSRLPRSQKPPHSLLAVVADDDEDSRQLLTEGLEQLGYRVVAAADGAELLEKLAEVATRDRYLVVTDLDMPRLGGFAALDVIAKRFPGARVLVVTGWRDAVVRDEALARGARAVLNKPYSIRQLATLAAKELAS
jgi:CheY-like chemotaxis protein